MEIQVSQDVSPITELKSKAKAMLRRVQSSGRPLLITQRGRVAAILESVESYERREARYEQIEGVLKALKEAQSGKILPHDKALSILKSF